MANQDHHASTQELLLYADGELSPRDAGRVNAHLAACGECRARMAEIEAAIAAFMRVHRQACEPVADIAGPRALLKARLAELVRSSSSGRSRYLRFAMAARTLAYVCALMLVAALGAGLLYRQNTRHGVEGQRSDYTGLRPIPSLTPGSVRQVTLSDLCSTEHDEVVRAVPDSLREKVFEEYGIPDAPARDYEVDYLITPGLGGADDIRNLWPEPHSSVIWNSYVKDQLEDHLHRMVCDGSLSLQEAQHEIASDWIAAYKKYFHSDQPLSVSAASRVSEISEWTLGR